MNKINVHSSPQISSIVLGVWRLRDWGFSRQDLLTFIHKAVEMGVTTFDQADIYGDYECERLFGEALLLDPALRSRIQNIGKCGIKLKSEKYPDRQIKTYDYSYQYIIDSVDRSLRLLGFDSLDVLLLHRPAPLFPLDEVAAAFDILHSSGRVHHFGVSNFSMVQFEMLRKNINVPLVTNQIEISPYHLEHFHNDNITYLQGERIRPLAWSPLAGGKIFSPTDATSERLHSTLATISQELDVAIDTLALAWLLHHPSGIVPIIGTGKVERIESAVAALEVPLTDEQWYRIYIASTGKNVP